MIDEKKIELMKKLQRLAERGVGGEKEGAQKKLQQLMKKYDIEESDLSDDKLEDHEWKYHNDFELRLLKQTIYKVMGKDGLNQMYHYRSGKGKKTIQGVQCTKVQAIQIGIEYEFYCETWKEEHDFFFKCFVQKHKIFPTKEEMIIRPKDDVETSSKNLIRNFISTSILALTNRTTNVKSISRRKTMVFQRTGGGYRVFCNPPYGRAITDWVEKAYREGTKDNTIVVMLIPARTDTRYFHDFIQHRSEIRFVKGRLKFGNSKQAAPFPSMVVIFRGAGM